LPRGFPWGLIIMPGLFGGGERPALLIATAKIVVAIGFLSYFAAHWLSSEQFDQKGLSRLAVIAARNTADPAITGSIVQAAGATKLDPCVAPRKP
jgi:hypothetical protein